MRDARIVARELLGKVLVVHGRSLIITETEAYLGESDLASHARFGKTKRNEIMWETGGHLYVYLIYGIYEMVNIVTGEIGMPSAVLLRGGIGATGEKIIGPGKLTQYLGINRTMNGVDIITSPTIYIDDRGNKIGSITTSPRVGVAYARAWAEKKWRYQTYILPMNSH